MPKGIKLTMEHVMETMERQKCILVSIDKLSATSEVIVICQCGTEFKTRYNSFGKSDGLCKKCNYDRKRTPINEARGAIIATGFTPMFEDSEFSNYHSKIDVMTKDGYMIKTTLLGVTKFTPMFISKQNPYSIQNIKRWLTLNTTDYSLVSEEYPGNHKHIVLQCNNGHEFKITWAHLQSGRRCPVCKESNGETLVREWLDKNNVVHASQYTFDDLVSENGRKLRFDFATFDDDNKLKSIIEVQGYQHYFPVDFAGRGQEWAEEQFVNNKYRDKLKEDYCKLHNITLLIVKYDEFSLLNDILGRELRDVP